MTNRLGWCGDPRAIWKLWDEFGIDKSRMIGYWDPACPVKTGRKDVLATAYVRKGQTLVAVASWAQKKELVRLQFDWKSLGLERAKTKCVAPEIKDFQPAAKLLPSADVPIDPGRGWLLILKEE
jgi:hypothetical protein